MLSEYVNTQMRALGPNRHQCHRTCVPGFGHRSIRSIPLLLFCTLIGCGSAAAPMTGTWAVSFVSSESLDQTAASLSLHQSGDALSGTITAAGCAQPANVSGTVNDSSLSLQFVEGTATGNLTGTVNDAFTSATGTYQISGASCLTASGTGTWSAAFLSN